MFSMLPAITSSVKVSLLSTQFRSLSISAPILKDAATTASKTKKPAKKAAAKKAAAKPKTLTKVQLKSKEKPKRHASPFNLYFKEVFPSMYNKGETRVVDVLKLAAEKWKSEPDHVKEKFIQISNKEKEAQSKLFDEWNKKFKKPLTGYNKFIRDNIDKSKCDNIENTRIQFTEVVSKWKALTPDEKASWKNK